MKLREFEEIYGDVSVIDEETGEVTINPALYAPKYKGGLQPQEIILDKTPLEVPLGCEIPLTRNELLRRFGYWDNPMYDNGVQGDVEDWDFEEKGDKYASEYTLNEEGITAEEKAVLLKEEARRKEIDDLVQQKLREVQKDINDKQPVVTSRNEPPVQGGPSDEE